MTYRYLPHTADIIVAIDSPTLAELLQEALEVSRHLFVGDSEVVAREHQPMALATSTVEELVLAFLQDVLYRYTTHGFVPARLSIERVTPTELTAELVGEGLDPARHATEPEVKAVTRHGLVVAQTADGWHAEVLFDV